MLSLFLPTGSNAPLQDYEATDGGGAGFRCGLVDWVIVMGRRGPGYIMECFTREVVNCGMWPTSKVMYKSSGAVTTR